METPKEISPFTEMVEPAPAVTVRLRRGGGGLTGKSDEFW